MLRKTISVLLVFTILSSMLAITVKAQGTDFNQINNTAMDSTVSASGGNSFGTMLSEEINSSLAESSDSSNYTLTDLSVVGDIATVEYVSATDCTILVCLYDEDTSELLASGKSVASSGNESVEVTIETESMPKYFIATAYMLDNTNSPLTDEFSTELYTKAIQEVKSLKVSDFDADRVLNLDDSNETNFAVYSENTKIIEYQENYNIPVTIDDDNGKYVFSNATAELTSLSEGDIFSYEFSMDNIIIVRVDSISVDGDVVTITESDAELEDVFDYVKIEASQDTSDCKIDTSTLDEDVTLVDNSVTPKIPNTIRAVNVEGNAGASLEYTLMGDDDKKLSVNGTIKLSAEATLEVYISFKKAYIDFSIDYGIDYTIAIKAQTADALEKSLGSIEFYPVSGVSIGFEPKAVFSAEASIELHLAINGKIGFNASTKTGIENTSKAPKSDPQLKAQGELFIGFAMETSFNIISKKIAGVSLETTKGIALAFDSEGNDNKDHLCKLCFAFEASAKLEIEASVKIFKNTVGKIGKGISIKIGEFYYSCDYNDIGWGECPHNAEATEPQESTSSTDFTEPTTPVENTEPTESTTVYTEPAPYVVESGVCGSNITWELMSTGELILTGSGPMYNYNNYNPSSESEYTPWRTYASLITDVTISEGITTIGSFAFYSFGSLENVKIPNTVYEIGYRSFDSTGLNYIEIPGSVRTIRDRAFRFTYDLTVYVDEGLTTIDDEAFQYCRGLTLTLPSTVTYIGEDCFEQVYGGTVYCKGNQPRFYYSFLNCRVNFYYPAGNTTWLSFDYDTYDSRVFAYPYDFENNTPVTVQSVNKLTAVNLQAQYNGISTTDDNSLESTFENLIYNEDYFVVVVKSDDADDLLSADNLLYAQQMTADISGNISLDCKLRESYDDPIALAFGPDIANLSKAEILVSDIKYDGVEHSPEYTVKYGEKTLTEDVDYTVSGDLNVTEKGIYTLTFTGIGEYSGIINVEYSVKELYIVGDVNQDGFVSVADATGIQKYLVESITLSDKKLICADVDKDGYVKITDATLIQKYVVDLTDSNSYVGEFIEIQ